MGLMSKFNNANAFMDIDTTDFNYVSLKDLKKEMGNKPYTINGLFVNGKGKFGDEAVAIGDHILINLPHYVVEDVKEMLQDSVVIDAIKQGRVGIKVHGYTNSFSKQKDGTIKKFYSVEWLDL
jgi:hypothetical protein